MLKFLSAAAFILTFVEFPQTEGHGMLMDPGNRASRWRVNSSAPRNYNDNELYCGGVGVSLKALRGITFV